MSSGSPASTVPSHLCSGYTSWPFLEWAVQGDDERPIGQDRRAAEQLVVHTGALGGTGTRMDLDRPRRAEMEGSPERFERRRAMLAEMLEAADRLDDPRQHYWLRLQRMRLALEAGDRGQFDEALAACTAISDQLSEPARRWTLVRWHGVRALIEGRLEEAERLCAEALALGWASGRPSAEALYSYQLLGIRVAQGRVSEIEPLATALLSRFETLPATRALSADVACAIGRVAQARELLHRDARIGFSNFARDRTWLTSMVQYARVAAGLRDASAAVSLYGLLAPFHDRIESNGGVLNGCVAHYLGMLGTVLGIYDSAEAHFTEAEAIHRRLQAPGIALTRTEHARMLSRRRRNGDVKRAQHLLHQARTVSRGRAFATFIERHCGQP